MISKKRGGFLWRAAGFFVEYDLLGNADRVKGSAVRTETQRNAKGEKMK